MHVMRSWRWRRWLPVVVFALLACVMFYKLALTPLILARGDTFTFFYPYWDARNAAFRALQLPLWSPELFMGSPLLAEPQLGTFYPPNWLTAPFSAPDAIRWSILGHVLWAGLGTYTLLNAYLPRRAMNMPALAAGMIFALSGFVGAHVEQINQLQGIAWMPWLFWLFHGVMQAVYARQPRRVILRWGIGLVMAFAMQFFSGHTQTLFISGVGLGVYGVTAALTSLSRPSIRAVLGRIFSAALVLGLAALVTVLLVLPQFIPTLELTGMSNRGGSGFNPAQATAFSLPPHYVGRALLPSYDGVLFGEYIGTIGVIGLGLALLAVVYPAGGSPLARWRWVWLAIALIGVLFAFGRYNPLYYDVLAGMRGFNLFRVPARWLALFSLGAAMLAGMGIHLLLEQRRWRWRWRSLLAVGVLVALMGIAFVLPVVAPVFALLPEDITGSALPTPLTLGLWSLALVALLVMASGRLPAWGMLTLVLIELWGASQIMPFNDLAPRSVYEGQRFTVSQLLADRAAAVVPPRVLSISGLLFDLGDRDVLRERYAQLGMSEDAVQIAFTALKRQEMMASNLPLRWGIHTVDGYGGGILPTSNYTQLTALIMPLGTGRTVDGRLSEALAQTVCRGACVPSAALLRMLGVSRVITDKNFDVWLDDVNYDTTPWQMDAPVWVADGYFVADEVRVLFAGEVAPRVTDDEGVPQNPIRLEQVDDTTQLAVYAAASSLPSESHRLQVTGDATVIAVTLVNTRAQVFLTMTPAGISRALSSDIKMYTVEDSPRAILTDALPFDDGWQVNESALAALNADPRVVTMQGDALPLIAPLTSAPLPTITEYTSTRVVMTVDTPQAAYLVLSDAWYPHWQATINGAPTPIYRANIMFRAVAVPAGQSEVVFTFVPTLWQQALWAGIAAWVLLLAVLWRVQRSAG